VRIVEGIGIGVLAMLLLLGLLFLRRVLIGRRGGTIEMSVRLSTMLPGRGWASGLARFNGDELRWFRIFSFSPRARRVLYRRGMVVERRRVPDGAERLAMPADWVIVRCLGHRGPIEIAMAAKTVTGFLSWVESAPPGLPEKPSRRSRAG
jgi:hypothetical protein